ncbi:hypothetical protein MUN78_11235 [Leucobacter allii]|uniref:DUF4232 domain-containing protein n=1 Tax=Leucobacter allii TaxID=2932247 RepID=A0ABY4FKJ5_9MICO|nr:hypothetical protein [Leucobacter allii]UOQ56261.1 hypothetical protein MUN78_11235 [Leucobacter allii]
MSTLRDPVGPKDRKVYIRRRIAVLAVLLAIVAVVALVILRPGGADGAPTAADVELPSDIAGSGETAPEAAEGTADGAGGVPDCTAGQLKVTPITDKGDYAAGETPQLSLSVENTGEEACSADLGTAGMQFAVSSGDDEVWRSADCQEDPEHLAVIVDAGEVLESEAIAWDRTRSSPETCDITRDPVTAEGASYHLRVTAAQVQGTGTAQFLLY